MSSSKIQEYNLDPNMGLAKEESVQEVKIVSDEIKALIGTEIATQLSTLKTDIIAAMPSSSSSVTTPYNKKLTATFYTPSTKKTTVSGVGLITVNFSQGNSDNFYLTIDGKYEVYSFGGDELFYLQLPFFSSVAFYTKYDQSNFTVVIQK